jgi:hypothetical protein
MMNQKMMERQDPETLKRDTLKGLLPEDDGEAGMICSLMESTCELCFCLCPPITPL